MNKTYGKIDTMTANVAIDQEFDAGADENQIALYIDNPVDLSRDGVLVSIKSLNTAGPGGGNTVWATTQAQAKLAAPFGPTNNADEGLLLVASAPNTEKWRIEFLSTADQAGPLGITWMAVCGRSNQPEYLTQRLHLLPQALPAGGAWVTPVDQQGIQPFRFISWSVLYTRASATGAPKFRVMWTDVFGNTFEDTGSNTNLNVNLAEPVGPVPPGAGAQLYTFAAENFGAFDQVRLEAAESGDTANPGTLGIFMAARSNL